MGLIGRTIERLPGWVQDHALDGRRPWKGLLHPSLRFLVFPASRYLQPQPLIPAVSRRFGADANADSLRE
jgi:hypothetical protein